MEYGKIIGIWFIGSAVAIFLSVLSINQKIISGVTLSCIIILVLSLSLANTRWNTASKILAWSPIPLLFLLMIALMIAETINGKPL